MGMRDRRAWMYVLFTLAQFRTTQPLDVASRLTAPWQTALDEHSLLQVSFNGTGTVLFPDIRMICRRFSQHCVFSSSGVQPRREAAAQ